MARIVFVGDDFTGASDTLATLAERGAKVRLFLDAPEKGEADGLDAVGIATDLRAREPEEIQAKLSALAPAISALGPRFIHYKVCSTFDSAPHVGSIGAAARALEAALAPAHTVVLGGQPSLGRHCLFGTLFARAPDGETYRIDRHPIMSCHPVTPMGEADLRVHLARQGLDGLALVSHVRSRSDPNAFSELTSRPGRTLVDAVDQSDVDRLGEILCGADVSEKPFLVIGASGVAEALSDRQAGPPSTPPAWKASGPILAIAGSRSSATAAQVVAATSFERLPLERDDLSKPTELATRCIELLRAGCNVLVHLRPELDYGQASAGLSGWLAKLARAILLQHRVTAIAVAGGDTSSAVVTSLGFRSLSFLERAGAGVAVCRGHASGSALEGSILLLKGGQVGDVAVFDRFAARSRG